MFWFTIEGIRCQEQFNQIKNQTFKDIECIIVDDGLTEPADDIIKAFMEEEGFPVCYIKKENGGVRTARNLAIKNTNED